MSTGQPRVRDWGGISFRLVTGIVIVLLVIGIAVVLAMNAVPLAGGRDISFMFVSVGMLVLFLFLTTLPTLMVLTYRSLHQGNLEVRVEKDLLLCGLESEEVRPRVEEFAQKNRGWALGVPLMVNLIALLVFWGGSFAPTGVINFLDQAFSSEVTDFFVDPSSGAAITVYELDLKHFVQYLVDNATLVNWAFLGAYFYIVMILIRRWQQNDLTAGVIWRLNVRLVVMLILGVLMIGVLPDANPAAAFLAGIVPESMVQWLYDRLKNVLNVDGSEKGLGERIFQPPDVQRSIGLSFWESQRLLDEGIENIQGLATEEIPDLLIRTRIKTQRLIQWIDRALLCYHVGEERYKAFTRACILTASDLMQCVYGTAYDADWQAVPEGATLQALSDSINRATTEVALQFDAASLKNLVTALGQGPNLPYIRAYWQNTNDPSRRLNRVSAPAESELVTLAAAR